MGLFKRKTKKAVKPPPKNTVAKLKAKPRPENTQISPETARKLAAALRLYMNEDK